MLRKMVNVRNNFLKIFFTILSVFLPVASFAAQHNLTGVGSQTCDPATEICNPITQTDLTDFLRTLLEGVIKIGIPVIALAIIYSGFLFVMARGNPEELKTAKRALLYSVIGAAILLGAWAIAKLITDTVLQISTP